MKRTLQAVLVVLMFVSAVSGAETKKAKGETDKKLVPAASTEADQQAESKKVPAAASTASLPHIPSIPMIQAVGEDDKYDPDLPQHFQGKIDKAEYLRLRDEYLGILRGIDPDTTLTFDIARRNLAIQTMEHEVPTRSGNVPFPGWMPLGPSPVPNGQTQQFPTVAPVSGRATCVVVDPTNSNKVYLGTAQGGVWRTLDGGATWTPIFDAAQSLAIGALALAPSNPTILYVGTGEPNNSADSYFGVGVYRIDNADTSADLVGPINPSITTGTTTALTYNCFNGRTISRILVNPTDPANIFVSTAAGVAGAAGNALSNTIPPLALRGVFRSANATAAAASVTFQKIIVNTDGSLDNPGTGNTSIFDMAFEPGNANNLLVSTSGAATGGAIYRSTNALAATPAFTQTLFPGFNGLVMHLAINKVGAIVTAYVASNEPSSVAACSSTGQAGRVRKSVDGGVTWSAPLVAAEGFCGGQCSYDNPVAVDPNNANIVYIGGNARGSCSDVLKRSADGGTTFTQDDNGLHADSHGLFMDPLTVPTTVWFTNDGGVWKRQDAAAGTAWLNQNTNGLNTIQFVGLAVHPTDQFMTLGGTQDNGTEAMTGSYGNWVSAESGDGGFALIDQSSTDTTNVTMYHTFFNQTNNFIGFDRTNLGTCLPPPDANKDSWEFRGGGFANDPTLSCDGTAFTVSNGINKADTVLFYAPMALGPGTPNTLYFGTDRLYRSTDRGDTMTVVSQGPIVAGVAVSAIGIAPGNDNIRIIGLRNGKVFATTTGANPLTDTGFVPPVNATASATNKHVARAVIDPLNNNTAYVTLAYYTNPSTAGQIWRTTNLNAVTPTWTSIGKTATGLPNVPVNGFVADGGDPGFPGVTVLYAGTDIGVFVSTDSGASWNPFGNPLLPRVAVFDLVLQPSFRILRAATHGRGAWQIGLPGSNCVPVPPTPIVTPGGPTTFCTGGSVTLTSSSATGNQWYDGVTLLPGQTNQTYIATTSGNYNVVVTALCPSAPSATTTVTVNPLPATPSITPGGPTTFCAGGSVTLTSSAASGNQWLLNGNPIGGATNTTYAATLSGSYTVTTTDGNSCTSAASSATVVTVNPLPATPTITPGGPTTFCAGGSVTLTSSAASGNQWLLNGNPIGGATNTTYAATASGSYTVTTTDGNSCTSAASSATVVTVNPLPATPTITPGGPTTFCAGGSVTLTSSAASGNQWSLNGNPIGGATNTTYAATASGSYTVTTTDGNSCISAASAATVVTVNPIPATPTITPGGPTTFCAGGSVTLTSSSASGNQWLLNGNPIGGATSNTFSATASGNYTVTVTASGCTSASSAATVVTVNPNPNATITTPSSTVTGSTGNIASVANAGVGATYTWGITNGTITAGTGTNSITYTAGAVGTLTLNVTVTTGAGCSDTKSANVNVVLPTVTVTSVSPTGGTIAGGSSVTINGTGFNAGATVTFGGSAATNVVVVSSIKITARTPAHTLGAVNVTVTNTDTSTGTLVAGYLYKPQQFDPNNDGTITSADIFYLVNFLFLGGPPPSGAAGMLSGDANGDGVVNTADIFYLVNYLFLGGPRPNAPTSSLMPTSTSTQGTATPEIAGSITLGTPVLRSGRYVVPVIMTTRAGSIAPQAMSLRLHFDREVGNVTIGKAGAAKDLAAPFEITRRSGNDVSYLVSYGGLALGKSNAAVVAEIGIDSVDGAVAISVDPRLTMLSDQAGLTSATVENGKLEVNGTAIRSVEPRPHTPDNNVN